MALSQINNMKWLQENHLGLKDVFFVNVETRSGEAVELKIWNPDGFEMSSYSVLWSESPKKCGSNRQQLVICTNWMMIYPLWPFFCLCVYLMCVFFALKWYFSNLGLHLHKGGGLTADRLKKEWLKSKYLRLRCPDFYFLVGGSWKCLNTSGLYHRLSGLNLTRLLQGHRRHYSTVFRLSGNFKVTVAEMTLMLDKKKNKKRCRIHNMIYIFCLYIYKATK